MTVKTTNPLQITVLKGGTSFEREISLASGAAVAQALRTSGHLVTEVDLTKDELPKIDKNTIVFPVLHGPFGEDGKLQKLLEDDGFTFVGCGSRCSEALMDKVLTDQLARDYGILMPKTTVVNTTKALFPPDFNFPVIVKPATQGSSFGLSLVESESGWEKALSLALESDEEAVVQEFIDGIEVAVGVVEGKALTVVEIIPEHGIFDFDAKYAHLEGDTIYNCPPKLLSSSQQKMVQDISEVCFSKFSCRDMTRMDFIIREDEAYFIEGNTIPGFTSSSLLPKAAADQGVSFPELCDKLVQAAALRK